MCLHREFMYIGPAHLSTVPICILTKILMWNTILCETYFHCSLSCTKPLLTETSSLLHYSCDYHTHVEAIQYIKCIPWGVIQDEFWSALIIFLLSLSMSLSQRIGHYTSKKILTHEKSAISGLVTLWWNLGCFFQTRYSGGHMCAYCQSFCGFFRGVVWQHWRWAVFHSKITRIQTYY